MSSSSANRGAFRGKADRDSAQARHYQPERAGAVDTDPIDCVVILFDEGRAWDV